ncbi:COMM domain-containing protein 1 [Aplysia californica]|uniref:COMM domain-containing protein 1 n=1 Tax=Aplysia californica TaxID=6500 RepID=A0ABM0KAJ5_APLCA|nr:COMM domain-containing protein 1 [Aplysia californica]
MIIKMADDAKCFQALLNGLAKRNYYGVKELTDDVLKEEIYPELGQEEFNRLNSKCTGLLKNLVSADMDMTQLEAFLTAQMKRKEGGMSEEQAAVMRKFWKGNKAKIHDSIVSQTMWGNSLQKVSWRVDLKSQSMTEEQINTPTAIMELQVADNLNKQRNAEVIRFELDEDKVAEMLSNMREIDAQIHKYTGK